MSDQLEFDEQTRLRLEKLYASADVIRRRSLVTRALAAVQGERILDVGCGPGFYVAELADAVGGGGHITGVDSSETMLAAAAKRTEGSTHTTLLAGEATNLPVPDGAFDAALSVQVYEYVDDISGALAEMYRVLRRGGRLILWDVDWSTVSWYSTDTDRMANALQAWDEHLAHPALPQWLATQMSDAGFVNVRVEGHAFVNTDAGPDSYSGAIMPLIHDFISGRGVTVEEADEWRSDLETLSDAGEYFFAVTQFCFSADKPK